MPISETSNKPEVDAVRGENTGQGGTGVHGVSDTGPGVHAVSTSGRGLEASSSTNYGIRASSTKSAGLRASSVEGRGLEGWSTDHEGVVGTSKTGAGVYGTGTGVAGVVGDSQTGAGKGVEGRSGSNTGVNGLSDSGRGVEGRSNKSDGVFGSGRVGGSFEGTFEGVHAVSHDPHAAGVAGYNDRTGPGIFGKSTGGGPAAYFDGNVVVTGVIQMIRADYAEEFTVTDSDEAEPGMVMVLDDHGGVRISRQAYDMRVVGVVSGAGLYKPAVILDHDQTLPNRVPLALMGKVYCKVDATDAPVGVGDLLTTSSITGHAMKAADSHKAFGTVIGKALQPLAQGQALVPILVRLQ
jgi:hypothetical protein